MLTWNPITGTATTPSALVQAVDLSTADHAAYLLRYAARRRAWEMAPYSGEEQRLYGLFLARDPQNNVIAYTRRVNADFRFVVEKDVAIVAGPLSLEVAPAVAQADPAVAQVIQAGGEAIWQRSALLGWWERAVRDAAICGDLFIEAVRTPAGAVLVAYKPESVRVVYDDLGTHIVEAVVSMTTYDPPAIDAMGIVSDVRAGAGHVYVRRLTRERIDVWRDGAWVAEESGEHRLGVVPLVHACWVPYAQPEHGVGAAEGIESGIALVDSLTSQLAAIGNRHANPILLGKGVGFDGLDTFKFGRSIAVPAEADASYLEANLQGVSTLLEAAEAQLQRVRSTLPHFGLFTAGANSSGEALKMLASDFTAYAAGIRARMFGALALATGYARAMDAGVAWTPDGALYRVTAPPVLPVDVSADVERTMALVERGLMTRATAIARLQSAGLIPAEQAPIDYAAAVATEQAELDAAAMDRLAGLRAQGAVIADETDPERVAQDLEAIAQAIEEGDTAAALEELAALRAVMGRGRG